MFLKVMTHRLPSLLPDLPSFVILLPLGGRLLLVLSLKKLGREAARAGRIEVQSSARQ